MSFFKKNLSYFLIFLLLVTFAIRLTGLTFSPPGFFCDETSIGYNAFSILETGKDEKGTPFPVFFKAFGDYKNPVYIYLASISIKLFGLSVWSVRFTSAFLGIASILLFIYFLRLIGQKWPFALSGGLVLSLMPWHFQFSRVAFEAISLVFFIILSMVFFALYLQKKQPTFYLFFSLSMVVAFFAYSTGRLVIPISALIIAYLWREEIFKKRIIFLISTLAVLLLILILAYDHFIDPAGILARPQDILITDDHPLFYIVITRFLTNYINHFSPEFLFQRGDLNLRHSSGVSSMLLTSFLLPLLWGLIYFFRQFKKSRLAQFLILQFFLFPLPASLTIIDEGAQATRTLHVVPFLALIIIFGFWNMVNFFKREKKKYLTLAFLIFLTFESIMFYRNYFTVYPVLAINNFEGGMPEAMEFAFSQKAPYYYISTSVCKYRIEIPFFMKYPPAKFQEHLVFPNARCLYSRKITNPIAGSIAVYKATDFIPHFPKEKLLKTVFSSKETVQQKTGTQQELYVQKVTDLYYVYQY